MSDYIKREDALKAVDGIHEDDLPRNNKIEVCDVLTLVVPSADVAPVRHGHWTHERLPSTNGGSYAVIRCSECQLQVPTYETRYCPNCGARMDGDENETDRR